jgi:hypothetical protein
LIKAKGKAKRKLNRSGRAKVKLKVRFKAQSVAANVQSKRIKLVRRASAHESQ